MSVSYAWALKSIKKADADGLQGIIVQTTWTCTGVDADGDEGVFHGATPFKPEEVDAANFTAYEDLTEAQVLGWIQAVAVGPYWDHIEGQIAKQIAAKKTAVVEVSEGQFPWSPPAEAPVE